MADRESNPVIVAKGGGFIDVFNCGSTVIYCVSDADDYSGSNFSGTVQLSDCSRMIAWSFDCDDAGVQKVDEVIEHFSQFRSALIKAKKLQTKKEAARKKKEEEEKK